MYRGTSRGDRSVTVREKISGPLGAALAAVVAAALVVSAVSIARLASPLPLPEATAMTRALAAPAFLVAGILRLARWRITGEQHCGLRALAMLLMGGIALPSSVLAHSLSAPGESLATVTCIRAVTLAVVLYVMAVAVSGGPVNRPGLERRVTWLTLGTVVVTGSLVVAHGRISPSPTIQVVLAVVVAGGLAVTWLTLTVGALAAGRHEDWARSAAPALAAMGVAELFRLPGRPWATLVAVALTAAVGFLVASSALVDLVRAAEHEHDETIELTRELAHARDEVSTQDAWRAELTHDARSTLAGIRAALQTLERLGDRLDPEEAVDLRAATFAELGHLEHMLVRRGGGTDVFDVAEVVRAVTGVRRAAGMQMDVRVQSALVLGVPGDLATVLQNLLVNAHQHGAAAPVSVDVAVRGGLVRITVADQGPGLPSGSADSVFDRGFRGPDSGGSGLGLSIARNLVRRNGGELELGRSETGATFVVSLPVAAPSCVEASRDPHAMPVAAAS